MLHSQETKYLTIEKYEENCILNSRYTLKKKKLRVSSQEKTKCTKTNKKPDKNKIMYLLG